MKIQKILKWILLINICVLSQLFIFANVPKTVKAPQVKKIPVIPPEDILIKMETTMGTVYFDLFKAKDPITADYFLKYIDNKFYNGVIFHRIIDGFVIQAGAYNINYKLKPGYAEKTLINQSKISGLKNDFGTIAISHKQNDPHIATSEFFINLSQNSSLDAVDDNFGYTVIGRVCQGMDVIQKIATIKIGERKDIQNAPAYPNEALIKEISRVSTDVAESK